MKKIAIAAAAAALALALAGCAAPAASSSSAAPEASSSSASASSSAPTINWKTVKTADEAAKGAGIDSFGVMQEIKIDDATYKNPAFSYAEGVANANYETGAIGVIVRKADGKHTAPLTDRDTAEFAETWTKSYEDLDVTLYGPAKGAATVVTWKDGTAEYGVTYQGLGGEEVTMDSDDVAAVVKGIKEANTKEPEKKDEEESDSAESKYISEQAAKDAAVAYMNSGVPDEVTAELVEGGDAPHYVVTINYGGDIQTVEVDALTGDVWSATSSRNDDDDDDDDDADDDNDADDDDDDDGNYIGEKAAENAAISSEGTENLIDVDSELVVGGDAPHYDVTLNYGGGDIRTVQVDALTGDVW